MLDSVVLTCIDCAQSSCLSHTGVQRVRAWSMCGLIAKLSGRLLDSLKICSRIVDIHYWGCRFWSNVLKEDRGIIFGLTFVRGVKRTRLSALHAVGRFTPLFPLLCHTISVPWDQSTGLPIQHEGLGGVVSRSNFRNGGESALSWG